MGLVCFRGDLNVEKKSEEMKVEKIGLGQIR